MYVVRKLEHKYLCQNTQESIECCQALREMAGKLNSHHRHGTVSYARSNEWTRFTNCGGLYHVDDVVYELFVILENFADEELSSIFKTKGKGIEEVKKEKLRILDM